MRSETTPRGPRRSEELTARLPGGLELCYQTYGDPSARPLLLVMGLGGPMTWWPDALCARLADEGFFVLRYDNRDSGRSTHLDEHRVTQAQVVAAFLGRGTAAPYSLSDLARDGFGLLDHLGLERAHVTGLSMGGMIAQTMAVEEPQRVLSLTSLMSSTGRRRVGWQDPSLLPHLLQRPARTRTAYVERSVEFWRRIASPDYADDDLVALERAEVTWERGVSYAGAARQTLAVLTQPDRTAALGRLRMPSAVVHGLADRMVHVSGGRATARAIPGADLHLVPGMGHDLPTRLFELLTDVVTTTAGRVR